MKKPALDVVELRRVKRLCEIGARPPVIKQLMPTVNDGFLRAEWEAAQGFPPPKGRLPLLEDWFFTSYQIKLQASYVAAIWARTTAGNVHYVDAYLAAWDQYTEVFPNAQLSFERVWFLIRTLSSGMLTTVRCPDCESVFIHNPHELINYRTCPACRIFGFRAERAESAEKNRRRRNRDSDVDSMVAVHTHSNGIAVPLTALPI